MEAALRSAYFLITGENPPAEAFREIRGVKRQAGQKRNLTLPEISVNAVVSGLKNTRKLMEAVRKKEVHYHFVEVMACPGGCSGGGGQPIHDGYELAERKRRKSLFP